MRDLDRITRSPEIMGGKPCVRGMRVTVGTIVGLVASGHSNAEILAAYPYLKKKTSAKLWPMPPGGLKRSKCPFRPHELAGRYERSTPLAPTSNQAHSSP